MDDPSRDPDPAPEPPPVRKVNADVVPRPGRSLVPWALMLPAVLLMAAVLALRLGSDRDGPREAVAPPDSPPDGVQGWSGRRALEGARELRVTLLPLHAEPDHQAFDARVLAERFDLPPGQPWRLVVDGADALDGRPAVVDRGGARLAPLLDACGPGALPAGDPLRALFLPPETGSGTWVLWGPEPGDGAEVTGLGRTLALTPEYVLAAEFGETLLRVARVREEGR